MLRNRPIESILSNIMSNNETLYTKILLWAYSQKDGFTEQELLDEFGIKNGDVSYNWYLKVFKDGSFHNAPLVAHFKTVNDVGYWCLTEKGHSAAVSHLELHEARIASTRATWFAAFSILLALFGFAATVYGLLISRDALELTRASIEANSDPLVQYEFDNDRFRAFGANNVRVESVGWYLPAEHEGEDKFVKMDSIGGILTIGKLQQSYFNIFLDPYEHDTKKAFERLKCYDLNGYGEGVPVYVNIKYSLRGENNVVERIDLVYIKSDNNDRYFVDIYKSDASQDDISEFLKSSLTTARVLASMSLDDEDYSKFCGNSLIYNPEKMF